MSLTRWQPEKSSSVRLASRLDWPGLLAELERHFPSPNIFYALRLEGRFESVRARSVQRQETDRHVAAACGWLPAAVHGPSICACTHSCIVPLLARFDSVGPLCCCCCCYRCPYLHPSAGRWLRSPKSRLCLIWGLAAGRW